MNIIILNIMKLNIMKRNIMSWNTMNQNIRMINYRELYFRISNFRISTFRKSNDKKTGFVQKTLFLFFSISCALLFSFGCKPQRVITESIVTQSNDSTILQLKDSLHIREMQVATLESELKNVRRENINLRSETVRYEINYDIGTAVDSITKRHAVISEVYTVSKKLYEESVREYEMLLQEAYIENRNLLTRNSDLKLINESLERENLELKSESNSKSERTSESGLKNIIIIAVVILVLMGVVYTNFH